MLQNQSAQAIQKYNHNHDQFRSTITAVHFFPKPLTITFASSFDLELVFLELCAAILTWYYM